MTGICAICYKSRSSCICQIRILLNDYAEYVRTIDMRLDEAEKKMVKLTDETVKQSSQKHLEKCLKDRNERIERLTNDLHRYVEDNKEFKRIIYEREQEIERYINQLKKEREERITQPFKHGNCCE
jgi:septal ring factor EnvC (AmiA/AmiB activator)